MTDTNSGPVHEEPDVSLTEAPADKDTGRFAVYDRRFARFVGDVSEKGKDKPKIGDVKGDRPASDFKVVEV